MDILLRLATDRRGAAAAEYAMVLALCGAAIAVAAVSLGDAVACSIDRATLVISGQDAPAGHQYGHSDPKGNAYGQHKSCSG